MASNPSNHPLAILQFIAIYTGICALSGLLILICTPALLIEGTISHILLPLVRRYNTGQSFWNMKRLEKRLIKLDALLYRINIFFAGTFGFRVFTYLLEPYDGVTCEFSGDALSMHENAIVISNHVTDFDFVLMLSIAARLGMLGHVKFMAKNVLKYIPGAGWGMYLLRFVFLRRNWQKDQKSIAETFNHLHRSQVPLWLISFLEGTRITEEKLEQSRKYAREHGLQDTQHVMIPRVKGFISMIRQLAKDGYVQEIVDLTLGYCPPSKPPTFRDMLSRRMNDTKVCINTRIVHIKDIPMETDEALTQWCYETWYRKERLLSGFHKRNEGKPYADWHFNEQDAPIYENTYDVKDFMRAPFQKQFEKIDALYDKKSITTTKNTKKKQ